MYLRRLAQRNWRLTRRAIYFIEQYEIPQKVRTGLSHRHLSHQEIQLVERALKQFFSLYAIEKIHYGKYAQFIMPSRVAYEMWQIFSNGAEYEDFCLKAFGNVLVLEDKHLLQQMPSQRFPPGLVHLYCNLSMLEYAHDFSSTRSEPLIFEIDAKLQITPGLHFNQEVLQKIQRQIQEERKGE